MQFIFCDNKKKMSIPEKKEKYILYQGAVNEGRCFETLIPAMKDVDARLLIYGDGNFLEQTKKLIQENNLEEKIILKGKIIPEELNKITVNAYIGITLFDAEGLSNYYSLANRFFDYMQAAVPQLCVDYPVYKEINDDYEIAYLIRDTSCISIAKSLNILLSDTHLYNRLQRNCLAARELYNWQNEEKKVLTFYKELFA
jgi:glycosyltransferase involved in cell wall biosynthesis